MHRHGKQKRTQASMPLVVQAQADKAKNFLGGAMKAAGVHVAAMRWRTNANESEDDEVCATY